MVGIGLDILGSEYPAAQSDDSSDQLAPLKAVYLAMYQGGKRMDV